MKVSRLEKWFMNRPQHADRTIVRADRLLRFVDLNNQTNFLEVGCGSGAVSNYVAKKYSLEVVGTDIDLEQLRLAQQNAGKLRNLRFFEADATNLPFNDNEFDLVLSFGVMHHIPEWLAALVEICRVLNVGGYFIYWDLVYRSLSLRLARLFQSRYGATTLVEINELLDRNHLTIVHSSLKKSIMFDEYEAVYVKH
jgi:ubiquinone/menaquinone biosynthesis C-methylase UbiE